MSAKICSSCGAGVTSTQKFCSSCGAQQFGDDTRFCSKCSASIPEKAKFCTRCGTRAPLSEAERQAKRRKEEEQRRKQEEEKQRRAKLAEEERQKELEQERIEREKEKQEIIDILDNYQNKPPTSNLEAVVEDFDKLRKTEIELDDEKKLFAFLNLSSTIIENYDTRPYLIRAIQGFDEAFIISSQLNKEDLANQIRFILAKLNLQFGDIIPRPSRRLKYYNESYEIIKELIREVKQGDIVGKDTIMVYMLQTEILQRKGSLKRATVTVETALNLSKELNAMVDETKLLKCEILTSTARYDEAFELLDEIDSTKLKNPVTKDLLAARISYLLGEYEMSKPIMEELVNNSEISTQDRIKIKKELANIYLESDPEQSISVFKTVYDEELDPSQKKQMNNIENNLKQLIKRSNISRSILLDNAENEFRNRLDAMREAQGRQNWEGAVNNGRRLLELLFDYGDEIDPENERSAEINFRLGESLFNNEEYEQALAYYEKAVSYYEKGIGEKSQHPTAVKKFAQTLIKLSNYQEAYEQAKKGKQLAEDISHPGLIQEFENMVEQFNPERIKQLQAFTMFMMNSIQEMADKNSFYTLFRILGLNASNNAEAASQLFIPMTMNIFRMDMKLPLTIITNFSQVTQMVANLFNIKEIRPLFLNPAGVFREIPKFSNFIPFAEKLGRPVNDKIMLLGVMGSMVQLVAFDPRYKTGTNLNHLVAAIKRKIKDGLTQAEIVVAFLASLIKAIDISVEVNIE